MVNQQIKNQHLLWRAGFGPAADQLTTQFSIATHQLYASMVKASKKPPSFINVAADIYEDLVPGSASMSMQEIQKELQDEKKRAFQRKSREAIKDLNLVWLHEMVNSEAQLREKMAFFWHGHFACRNQNIFYQQNLLHEIRTNALGSFKDLLLAVSKSAAMLAFLNNQQNKKLHPNENFAREVMELFTLGRGHYTETDVKEAARAFTGWGYNAAGEFHFRKGQHDDGKKSILGRSGNFNGDDVINMLLEQKQTAIYISRKLYRFLVNDIPDEEKVQWLAGRFYESGYNITKLLDDIFTSNWFYNEKNIGTRIKSPVELVAGIRRLLPMKLENDDVQLLMQRSLGQVLFMPPNVAGWPGGKNWIDSSSLVLRMRIPQLIHDNDVFSIQPKTDDDTGMGMMEKAVGKTKMQPQMAKQNDRFRLNADVYWEQYVKQFETTSREQLYPVLEASVLQTKRGLLPGGVVENAADKSSRHNYIKSITIAFMSTPEYQLC
ncbi:DUF1800 domain-containing protein [Aridibaculum aurantiacum]|uniref:DUF1800 domain-containing protein n=1 Tax=Aridibaculum aurantiacum TaxID=2810307 RepID=UPI001A96798E|nr:DUF1800 domain-containing protein [Aridibaculum aurantiacum]